MKRVFIVGCPRSGTSWLRQMLGSHPRVAGAEETPLYYRYLRPLDAAWQAERALPPDDVRLSAFLDDRDFDDFLRAAADRVTAGIAARRPGADVVVDKTPNNTLDWRLILRLYPDAHFLHLVRDPRDVVCSLLEAARGFGADWAPRRVVTAARFWRDHVAAARAAGQAARFLEIRYETLLDGGAGELRRAFAWLGLEADEATSGAIEAQWRYDAVRGAGAWRRELSADDVRSIEYVAGPWMETFGYTRAAAGRGRSLGIWADKLRLRALAAGNLAHAGAYRLLRRLA